MVSLSQWPIGWTTFGCLATYHMPRAYRVPEVICIHTNTVITDARKLANNVPLIFAGDFNFQPHENVYALVTTGSISTKVGNFSVIPMKSAYKVFTGSEPKYTNHTFTRNSKDFFTATLDYIFFTNGLEVIDCLQLSNSAGPAPLPTKHDPSDHVLLTATFKHS